MFIIHFRYCGVHHPLLDLHEWGATPQRATLPTNQQGVASEVAVCTREPPPHQQALAFAAVAGDAFVHVVLLLPPLLPRGDIDVGGVWVVAAEGRVVGVEENAQQVAH